MDGSIDTFSFTAEITAEGDVTEQKKMPKNTSNYLVVVGCQQAFEAAGKDAECRLTYSLC